SVIINASVGARKGWPTTSTVSTCKAEVVHLARILSAELVGRGIRVDTLSPGPTDTAMFGRFPGEEQGAAVKDVLRTNNPSKRMADPLEIREAGSLPRVGRFCVRRRGRLPDRRRGHGHFGRGRLSLVAESRGRSCSRSPLLMPPDAARTIRDLAEIINHLWGHNTPGGRLYPGPLKREVTAIGWDEHHTTTII